MIPETFAALCAVPVTNEVPREQQTWTTGSGTGSDPDD